MSDIPSKHLNYFKGYQDGYEDMRKRITVMLWDLEKDIAKLDPEMRDVLEIAIMRMEKIKKIPYIVIINNS